MRDLLNDYDALMATREPVGRAVVTSVWGSAPRPEGSCMLASASGKMAGSVSGGCVESAVVQEIQAAIERGTPRLVTFGVSDEKAWEVGLACGGTIKVLVQPRVPDVVMSGAQGAGGVVVATILTPEALQLPSESAVVRENGTVEHTGWPAWLVGGIQPSARSALRKESGTTVAVAGPEGQQVEVFLEVFARRPKLVIFGGVHIAVALVPLAKMLGYYTVVADGRQAFLTRERFPTADELLLAWPEEAFRQVGLDNASYICLLSHDPKFDEPAMELALRSPAAYIGAIGSKKTQAARRERLRGQGFTEEDLARVHGPIGLDLGERSPAETALAIMAEMTAVRYGREKGEGRREK
jgi:xanthine dehydrogenase accessory factor